MKLAVFAYNFPHKKTQDFLLRLLLEGYKIELAVACDPIKLNTPPSVLRVKPTHIDAIHPETICKRFKIPYHVLPHNSPEVAVMMAENAIDIGVVAGARILKKPVIESVKRGIINFHPGIIPQVRGLDALKWAIYNNLPIGITAHFIDERVDAGRIIVKEEIPLKQDDTLIDISLRLEETQTNMLPRVLELANNKTSTDYPLTQCDGKANPAMANELELKVPERLAARLAGK